MSETLVHVASGKVRELFTIDDERLLLVASDRISTFDVVLPTEIPDKGRVLTGLSGVLVRPHARDLREPPARAPRRTDARPSAAGSRCCRSSASCAATSPARAGRTTSRPATSAGTRLPEGLRESDRLPEPIFTPSTKATTGHDENIDARAGGRARRRGAVRARSSARPSRCTASPPSTPPSAGSSSPTRSSSSVSTTSGELVLADEALTPDSSRFWPADEYAPGGAQPSFDKQFVRDYCESLGWDKTAPGPRAAGRRGGRHAGTLRRGVRAPDRDRVRRLPRATPESCCARAGPHEGDRARPAEGGHPRSAGTGRRGLASPARLRRRGRPGRAASSTSTSTPATPASPGPRSSGCASSCSRTR